MQTTEEIAYRLRLAEGFLAEAQQDMSLGRWRSCVDNSQLSVENAAKAALATLGPVGRTHDPAGLLRQGLADGRFSDAAMPAVADLAKQAELLGHDVHMETDYGSEHGWRTPWELFDEDDARQSLAIAESAVVLAQQVFQKMIEPSSDSDLSNE